MPVPPRKFARGAEHAEPPSRRASAVTKEGDPSHFGGRGFPEGSLAKTHPLHVEHHCHAYEMNPTTPPVLLKKSDVCKRLSLSLRTLESMVKAGTFPPSVRMGKHVYWSEAAILGWMSRMFGPQEAWKP